MECFKNKSFEIKIFKTWLSWKEYDLSFFWLQKITKKQLIDLLSNKVFDLKKNETKSLKLIHYSKSELLIILNSCLLDLHSPEYFSLFWIKDPRDNIIEDEKYSEKKFPKTILTLLTHWTYSVPSIVRWNIKENIDNILNLSNDKEMVPNYNYSNTMRVLKHFSDFWTRYLVKYSNIPETQIIKAVNSRLIWDPARCKNADDFIKKEDFSWNILLENPEYFKDLWEQSHDIYHNNIENKTNKMLDENWWYIIIDDHDTGILKIWKDFNLDKYQNWWFPLMVLSTSDWDSCNQEILEYYSKRIEYHLWIKSLINNPYKGWYVIQRHWVKKREQLKKEWKNLKIANVIQQEIGKFLYLDEKTQKIDHDKAKLIWIWLARSKADLWIKFDKKYFDTFK